LVLLDQELRKILPRYVGDDYVGPNGRRFIEATYLRPGYEDLGISTATFAPDLLTYSGKLLRDAHNVNPRSSYRKHTLYATLFPNGEDAGDIPDLRAARTYLREFPQGPFAADVFLELAHFRDDLFKVIRGILAGEAEALEYKYDCYAAYLTKQPYREQLRAAQKAGIVNYRRFLVLRPADELARESLAELSKGSSEAWFFWPD
jgi:hypothetical protein